MTSGRRSERTDELAIVLDENLASLELQVALAAVARAHEARVELIYDHVERGTLDETWLPLAAERRWAVITGDANIKRRPAEKTILMRAGVSVFILRGALNGDQIRDALVAPPIICHVSRDGEVTVIEGKRRGGIKR